MTYNKTYDVSSLDDQKYKSSIKFHSSMVWGLFKDPIRIKLGIRKRKFYFDFLVSCFTLNIYCTIQNPRFRTPPIFKFDATLSKNCCFLCKSSVKTTAILSNWYVAFFTSVFKENVANAGNFCVASYPNAPLGRKSGSRLSGRQS